MSPSSMGVYCARLANALAAVSGPEFALGSVQYRLVRCGPSHLRHMK